MNFNEFWKQLIHYLPLEARDWYFNPLKFFNLNYLVNTNPGSQFTFYPQLFFIFTLCIVLSVYFFIARRKYKDLPPKKDFFRRFSLYFLITGLVGYVLLGMRYENVRLLSSRLLLLISLVALVGWGITLLLEYRRKLPEQIRTHHATLLKQKYLPKKKTKRK